MSLLKNKTIQLLIAILSIAGYGVFVFAATPPAGGFAPGLELDPTCTPGHSIDNGDPYDCFVKQAWQQNVADGFVFNVDDNVGIGTDTPTVALDVMGSFFVTQLFREVLLKASKEIYQVSVLTEEQLRWLQTVQKLISVSQLLILIMTIPSIGYIYIAKQKTLLQN